MRSHSLRWGGGCAGFDQWGVRKMKVRNRRVNFVLSVCFSLMAASLMFFGLGGVNARADTSDAFLQGMIKPPEEPKVFSPIWIPCAYEGGFCRFENSAGITTIRYSGDVGFVYMVVKDLAGIPCNNFFADPQIGIGKQCQYTKVPVFKYMGIDGYFVDVAVEGQKFHVRQGPNAMVWVRYGQGQNWFYNIIEGGGAQVMTCDNNSFGRGFDPVPGVRKNCQYGHIVQEVQMPWKVCATEDQVCDLGQPVSIVKYGVGTMFYNTIIRNPSLPCSNKTFGDPVPGRTKFCSFLSLR